jgi:hypothetical protein
VPEDQIDLVEVDRKILAVPARGAVREVDLEIEERVLALESRGLMGVAATTARLLGSTSRDAGFRELRLRVEERANPPPHIHLGDRIAVVVLYHRLTGLAPGASGWLEAELVPGERVLQVNADANLAAVITRLRVLAFSLASGGFVPEPLRPREDVQRVSMQESSITLVTPSRILVFRAGAPRWITQDRVLR